MSLIDVNQQAVISQAPTQQDASGWLDGLTRGLGSLTDAAAKIYTTRAQVDLIKSQNRFGASAADMYAMLGQIPMQSNVSAIGPDGRPIFATAGLPNASGNGKLLVIGALIVGAILLLRR